MLADSGRADSRRRPAAADDRPAAGLRPLADRAASIRSSARVLVNRVWLHHFGRGIVATPGDFGVLGERPTHPELLDWLADEFMADGWRAQAAAPADHDLDRLPPVVARATRTLDADRSGQSPARPDVGAPAGGRGGARRDAGASRQAERRSCSARRCR